MPLRMLFSFSGDGYLNKMTVIKGALVAVLLDITSQIVLVLRFSTCLLMYKNCSGVLGCKNDADISDTTITPSRNHTS